MSQLEINFRTKTIRSLGGQDILTDSDVDQLGEAVKRVYFLMRDGFWHTRENIEQVAGTYGKPAKEGLRRMRSLRKYFTIERQRLIGQREWIYRLVGASERELKVA